jgi:hypothetical protein
MVAYSIGRSLSFCHIVSELLLLLVLPAPACLEPETMVVWVVVAVKRRGACGACCGLLKELTNASLLLHSNDLRATVEESILIGGYKASSE